MALMSALDWAWVALERHDKQESLEEMNAREEREAARRADQFLPATEAPRYPQLGVLTAGIGGVYPTDARLSIEDLERACQALKRMGFSVRTEKEEQDNG